jgi:hypothetical protein
MLVPMTSQRKDSVTAALLRIFTVLGAPAIIQTDNGREFSEIASRKAKNDGELVEFDDTLLTEAVCTELALLPLFLSLLPLVSQFAAVIASV